MTPAAALSPEYVLLGFLNQHPARGYELHQRIEAELGQIGHIRWITPIGCTRMGMLASSMALQPLLDLIGIGPKGVIIRLSNWK